MRDFNPVVPLEDITAEWLTEALTRAGRLESARVVAVTRDTCGTGQLGDSHRFALAYDRPGAGPATLIGKFASKDVTSREFGRSSGYYRAEIGFYTELAHTLPVSTPRAVHVAMDANQTDFVLLMEDLAPARSVDQLVGCNADEAARVLEQAAALHAAHWHDDKLATLSWIKAPVNIFLYVTDSFAGVLEKFPELGGDLVPDADLQEAAKLVGLANAWKQTLTQNQCLWHADLRADNVLFDAEDGQRPVVLLDWQSCGYGPGTMDVGLFLGTSLTVEDRRAHERDLLAQYHRALVHHGVQHYSAEQCWDDYRVNGIHGLQVGVFGLGAVKRTPRGDKMWKVWIERTAAQVRDLDSFTALARRA